jgi:tRNA(adenine34) deaminase
MRRQLADEDRMVVKSELNRSKLQSGREPAGNVPVSDSSGTDNAMMLRCIELSRIAVGKGEYPFGTVIALGGKIVAEAINRTTRQGDVTRHAEVIALSQVQQTITRERLRHCTLYTNIEPCAMCSYCIREAWIGRVVYALSSPVMGGMSKWNILRDDEMSGRMPEVFGAVPEVVSGVRVLEAQQSWRDWSPVAWQMIKLRGLLTEPCVHDGRVHVRPARERSLWHFLESLYERSGQARARANTPDVSDHEL